MLLSTHHLRRTRLIFPRKVAEQSPQFLPPPLLISGKRFSLSPPTLRKQSRRCRRPRRHQRSRTPQELPPIRGLPQRFHEATSAASVAAPTLIPKQKGRLAGGLFATDQSTSPR